MNVLEEFIAIFGVWEPAVPYLSMMVSDREMQLIVGMKNQPMSLENAAALLGMKSEPAGEFLVQCYKRCFVDKSVKDGSTIYTPRKFGARLNHFAVFENWDDIPVEDRLAIERCFLDEFIAKHRPNVEKKMQGLAVDTLPNDTVMLLPEVEAIIDAASHIAVLPCDCRRLRQKCSRPVETCLYLDNDALKALDRGEGKRLTKEEAKKLVRWADKQGLMHTSAGDWQKRGLSPICNCCACDCYPFRAGQELNSKGTWPKSQYIAVHNRDQCSFCGLCIKRCHFEAFYFDGSTVEHQGKLKKNVLFNEAKCWGCGLCANTCPTNSILMAHMTQEHQG